MYNMDQCSIHNRNQDGEAPYKIYDCWHKRLPSFSDWKLWEVCKYKQTMTVKLNAPTPKGAKKKKTF